MPFVASGDIVLRQRAEPHQGRGGVILAIIGAHAVEAAVIHQVGFLEAALAGHDVGGGHEVTARHCAEDRDQAEGEQNPWARCIHAKVASGAALAH